MSIVYIAGPMSNYEDYNFPAFHEAERQLMAEGYKVLSPARNFGGDQSLPYETYLAEAIRNVLDADWLYCLPGWRQSKGARLEAHIASVLGKNVMEHNESFGDGRVFWRETVRFDKFGTPSAVTPEAVDGLSRTASTLATTTDVDFSAKYDRSSTRPKGDEFTAELEAIEALHAAKRSDYTADGADKLANYRFLAGMIGVPIEKAMFGRIAEKLYRIKSLFEKDGATAVGDESMTDTLRDIAIIAILMKLSIQGGAYGPPKGYA
jgi:hypothetical protein